MNRAERRSGTHTLGLPQLLMVLLGLSACSSSADRPATGTLRGTITSRLHHGVATTDGEPSTSVSPSAETWVLFAPTGDNANPVDSVMTDKSGDYEIRLPVGTWVVSVAPYHTEWVPTGLPSPTPVTVVADSVAEANLQFDVYAP